MVEGETSEVGELGFGQGFQILDEIMLDIEVFQSREKES